MTAKRTKIRCAIYTRKSHEEGLDQEFNSLDAQRQAGEAFIESQRHEGWQCLPKRYDDGGFSGGTMDRPALDELLDDTLQRIDPIWEILHSNEQRRVLELLVETITVSKDNVEVRFRANGIEQVVEELKPIGAESND